MLVACPSEETICRIGVGKLRMASVVGTKLATSLREKRKDETSTWCQISQGSDIETAY